jgi:hypothetical protein
MKSNYLYHFQTANRCRPFALIVLATCSWADVTFAQDPAPAPAPVPTGADAPATPDSSAVKKEAKPGTDTIPSGTTSPAGANGQATDEKPKNPFRTGESTRSDGAAKKSPFAYDTGDTDTPLTKPVRKPKDPADSDTDKPTVQSGSTDGTETRFVAPSFYGRGPQVVTPGQGQFARPKFRYGISVGIGFDDNPNQTSTVNLSTVATPRSRSGFNYVNGHWDAQWLKPTTVFTVNLEASGDYYWNRPGNNTDFNGRLGVMYINKINPRAQFSANGSFAYLSQPDYSNLYASTNQVGGDYFTGSTKFDLNYRWAPHFSTTTSASVNLLKYVDDSASKLSNSYWDFTFGNEFRFQTSPRLTWIAEGRYGIDTYLHNSSLNSQTAYALGGLDWIASRHVTATFRAGATIRSYNAGGSYTAPYGEASLNYQTGRHSTLTLNGRYGFEQSTSAGDKNLSYRLGLLYQCAFTSRFSGNTGFNFVHTDFNPLTGSNSATTVYDFNVGLQYQLDRHFSIGARYSYTLQDSTTGLQNFDRNRFLFTAQYEY